MVKYICKDGVHQHSRHTHRATCVWVSINQQFPYPLPSVLFACVAILVNLMKWLHKYPLTVFRSTLSMAELLTKLTKKAKVECEEVHRQKVAALNGLAGLHIIKWEVGIILAQTDDNAAFNAIV